MKATIKSNDRISELFRDGRRVSTASILAVYSRCEGGFGPRTAVLAGKRLGSAPQRNRAKRLIREAARKHGAPWPGLDALLVARESLIGQGQEAADRDMARIARRLAGESVLPTQGDGREA